MHIYALENRFFFANCRHFKVSDWIKNDYQLTKKRKRITRINLNKEEKNEKIVPQLSIFYGIFSVVPKTFFVG